MYEYIYVYVYYSGGDTIAAFRGASILATTMASTSTALVIVLSASYERIAAWGLTKASVRVSARAMVLVLQWRVKSYHIAPQIYTATACYQKTSRAFVTKDGAAPTALPACAPMTALAMVRVLRMAVASAIRIGEATIVQKHGVPMLAVIMAHAWVGTVACVKWAMTAWIVVFRRAQTTAQDEVCA